MIRKCVICETVRKVGFEQTHETVIICGRATETRRLEVPLYVCCVCESKWYKFLRRIK